MENPKTIIFLHGDFQNKSIFKKIGRKLEESNFQTLSLDLPGHGINTKIENPLEFLRREIKKRNLIDPIIFGNSFGGTLATEYAIESKNVKSIIMLNSPLSNPKETNPDIDWEAMGKTMEDMSKKIFEEQKEIDYNNFKDLDSNQISGIGLKTTNIEAIKNHFEEYRNLKPEKIHNIEIPILYILSEEEKLINKEYISKEINYIKKFKLIFVKGDHNVLIKNPEEIIQIIRNNQEFLETTL